MEKREIYVTENIEWLPQKDEWANLKSIVMVKSERLPAWQSPTFEKRYYITSLPANALKVANAIRKHWSVENNLHRQLDINFEEDKSVINRGYAAENLATFRRLVLNILGSGKGLLERRRNAAWNEEYLSVACYEKKREKSLLECSYLDTIKSWSNSDDEALQDWNIPNRFRKRTLY